MTSYRIVIAVFALIGAVLGAALGAFGAPSSSSKYTASANVALLPPANLTAEEASSFWEVLTRGQVTRTAAVIYNDPRWLQPAAKAAKVPQYELSQTAGALPDTTMLAVTVTAPSPAAAEAALNEILTTATVDVTSLAAPYAVKVLWPPKDSAVAVPTPGKTQVAAAGSLGGLLVGGGIGWLVARRRRRPAEVDVFAESVDEEPLPR